MQPILWSEDLKEIVSWFKLLPASERDKKMSNATFNGLALSDTEKKAIIHQFEQPVESEGWRYYWF